MVEEYTIGKTKIETRETLLCEVTEDITLLKD
jgi:hypothetical protein